MPAALKVTGSNPGIVTSTVFVPGFGPSVSILCALPSASVIVFSTVNLSPSFPSPLMTVNVICTSDKGLSC